MKSVRSRLLVGIGVLVAALLALAFINWLQGQRALEANNRLYEGGIQATRALGDAHAELEANRAHVLNHVATDDETRRQDLEQSIVSSDSAFRGHLRRAGVSITKAAVELDTEDVEAAFERYAELRDAEVLSASREGRATDGLSGLLEETGGAFVKTDDALRSLVDGQVEASDRIRLESERVHAAATTIAALGTLVVAALGVVIALGLASGISSRIARLVDFTQEVRAGKLNARSTVGGDDEIGQLSQRFNEMLAELETSMKSQERESQQLTSTQASLTAMLTRIARGDLTDGPEETEAGSLSGLSTSLREMRAGLRKMTIRIHEAVGALSTAAVQLQAMAQESSAGAAESASGVAETAASVDEVARTAEVVATTARGVQGTSRMSMRVYEAGKTAVRDSVDAMATVRERMRSVAERILTLSEDLQEVDAVVATVNELAEQSNVLSLNAAIEAARAGEEGHGFAVVAREMRTLAEQSRAATSTVRSLLLGLQRSTGKVVVAAEEGSGSVEAALETATAAGRRIDQLQEVIRDAATSAEQIQSSAEQQVDGMSQISDAVRSIEQAARHGVDGARLLEDATRELNRVSSRLQQAIAHYRV